MTMKTPLIAIALVLAAGSASAESDYTPFGDSFNNQGAQASNCLYNSMSSNHWCDGTGTGLNAIDSGMGTDGTVVCTGNGTTPGWIEVRPVDTGTPDPNNYSIIDCWLYTGSNPGYKGFFVLPTNQPLKTGTSPHYALALCTGTMAITEANYQFSTHYALGAWTYSSTHSADLDFFLVQYPSITDPNSPFYPNAYLEFLWKTTPYSLDAYTSYSIHITCPEKAGPGS